jgi:hypothetical protein
MDFKEIEKIKKLIIVALFTNDDLMEIFVLKGGNAVDLVYKVSPRSSLDIDLSIDNEFDDLKELKLKIQNAFDKTFNSIEMVVFDLKIIEKPPVISQEFKEFWGGYNLTFKLLTKNIYDQFKDEKAIAKASIRI